jgi:CHAT domain-containing protein
VRQALALEQPNYAAWTDPIPCSLAQARSCLQPREVGLIFVTGDGVSHLLLVEEAGAAGPGLEIFQLPPAAEMAMFVDMLTDAEALALPARMRALGREACSKLLGPVLDKIRGKNLVIIPGGDLGQFPFQLLVEPGQDRYLIESCGIRYAPSFTVLDLQRRWFQNARRPRPERVLWALGDPIYESTDARLNTGKNLTLSGGEAVHDYRLPRLKNSRAEVQSLALLFGPKTATVLLDERASEAAVKAASVSGELRQHRYVHFASHAILGLDDGKQPALVLSLVGNDQEDGILQLDEITNLKLNADLVVLSACQTGKGRLHNGEGVRGLARAFLYAGSKGVVCSLWSVDDQETANLMVDFYRHLQKGRSAPEALREAQLAMIRAGKAPLYWAPFVLIGE